MQLHTQRLSKSTIDDRLLSKDIERMGRFKFHNPYGEFTQGECTCCYLWNVDGDEMNPFLSSYDGTACMTENALSLEYVTKFVTNTFSMQRLRFVRLAKLEPHSIIIPHKDYLELDDELVRIHVPIKTDENVLFGEQDRVFHLGTGEIWYLNAADTHTIASFSSNERIHMILDFSPGDIEGIFTSFKVASTTLVPEECERERPAPSSDETSAIEGLKNIISMDNYKDVLAMLNKFYFRRAVPLSDVYGQLIRASEGSGDEALRREVQEYVEYFMKSRDSRWSPEIASVAASA